AVYDEEGNINWENNTFRDNPMAQMLRDYQVHTKTLIANLGISYRLLPSLEFKTNLGYNNSDYSSFNTFPHTSRLPSDGYTSRTGSSIDMNTSARDSWIIEPQMNWMQEWNNLKLDVLVGSTFQQETTEQFVQRGKGFASNKLIQNIAAAETIEIVDDIDSEYNYQAFFGRVNLNWKDRYILNLTGRRDGSSRFGPGKQFGNFGALGVAWIFSNESFLKNNPTFNFGKIRASYGTTGSDNIGNYKFLDTYTSSNEHYNGTNILEPSGIFNPILAWEENKKLEVGLELGFFNDRIVLNTSWYRNRSSNQLIGIPLAATTGFGSLEGNFDAVVQNTGFELDLNTVNVQGKGFRWTTNLNITIPRNELLKFNDIENSTFANRYEVGKSLNIRYLFRSLGVNPDTGFYGFEDFNEDGLIDRTNDRQVTRDFTPDLYGGLGNTISYKNLSLDFFFQFKKQLGYNYYRDQFLPGYSRNLPAEFYERWQEPGDVVPYPRATAGLDFSGDLPYVGGYQAESDAAVTDASFIRLRNVLLTYRIPKSFSLGLDASVYLQGQNLLTITGYRFGDPEQTSYSYLPPLRQFTLGLNLNF
ncbi:MAG: SusC/RagA family TonB-linked outer membrane protein, partial [Flavobacteriaceae bacterium]|nr:SusC/RagA family TonB-linked outer membrane protein [Flavobacteriaceae bacterium]